MKSDPLRAELAVDKVEQAKQARATAEDQLESLPNVVGHGVGAKEVGGQITDEICVRVYVSDKVPASDLAPDERIPSSIAGVRTDVIQLGPAELLSDAYVRPPSSGTQIVRATFLGVYQMKGTICAFVRATQSSRPYLLTCAHVLDPTLVGDKKPIDDVVHQPTAAGFANRIGWCNGGPYKFGNGAAPDCGLASIDDINHFSSRIMHGDIYLSRTGSAAPLQRVAKCGATTDTTTGIVVDAFFKGTVIGLTVEDGYLINSAVPGKWFADHGDSGSPLYLPGEGWQTTLIGMVWAMDAPGGGYVYGEKIENVFNALGMTLSMDPDIG